MCVEMHLCGIGARGERGDDRYHMKRENRWGTQTEPRRVRSPPALRSATRVISSARAGLRVQRRRAPRRCRAASSPPLAAASTGWPHQLWRRRRQPRHSQQPLHRDFAASLTSSSTSSSSATAPWSRRTIDVNGSEGRARFFPRAPRSSVARHALEAAVRQRRRLRRTLQKATGGSSGWPCGQLTRAAAGRRPAVPQSRQPLPLDGARTGTRFGNRTRLWLLMPLPS